MIISASHVTKLYGSHKALDDINFTVKKGQIIGFLGPNGAGKTTTMNILTGYISATAGSVKIDGYDILEHGQDLKQYIGYLPEQPPLYLDLTVIEYLRFVAALKKIPRQAITAQIDTLLELIKITNVKDRLLKNLSKGYRQRVGLAQALLGEPEILILDEPTVGLDPQQIIEFRQIIKNLRTKHTILLSSHVLGEIEAVCDEILIINSGQIIAQDSSEHLSQQLLGGQQRIIIQAKGAEEDFTNALHNIPAIHHLEVIPQKKRELYGFEIYTSLESEDIKEKLFNAAVKNSATLLELSSAKVNLEEIFLLLTAQKNKE